MERHDEETVDLGAASDLTEGGITAGSEGGGRVKLTGICDDD